MQFPSSRLIVFAKAPIEGQVKTRLTTDYDAGYIAKLHAAFVTHTLHTACRANLAPVELWCAPDQYHPFFEQCASRFSIKLNQQQGADLGQRMSNAFAEVLKQADQAVIVGCDCPLLTENYLLQAFTLLSEGSSAVIGPANDGGYTLLGLQSAIDTLFSDMTWGTDQVLSTTLNRLKLAGLNYRLLPYLPDVDLPIDLQVLIRQVSNLDLHPELRDQLERAQVNQTNSVSRAESA